MRIKNFNGSISYVIEFNDESCYLIKEKSGIPSVFRIDNILALSTTIESYEVINKSDIKKESKLFEMLKFLLNVNKSKIYFEKELNKNFISNNSIYDEDINLLKKEKVLEPISYNNFDKKFEITKK